MSMTIRQYTEFIVERIEAAEAAGDRIEAARILRLLAETATEQAEKLAPSERAEPLETLNPEPEPKED